MKRFFHTDDEPLYLRESNPLGPAVKSVLKWDSLEIIERKQIGYVIIRGGEGCRGYC
jgi:hypothetical protein